MNKKSSKSDDFKQIMLGKQTFEFLIENNYLYVDKTKEIYNLVNNEKTVFLSRPRRFGKSLLVNTLESLFLGDKKLFKDLYIYDYWDWDKKYKVIHLDLSKPFNENNKDFKDSLNFYMDRVAKNFSIDLFGKYPNDKLSELIEELHKKYGEVVVLVDEYDAPILDNINDQKIADANRRSLQSFYQALKNSDEYIDFIFITGISKFIHTFSKLNNPTDITLMDKYSSICGIRHDELKKNCDYYINILADKNNMTYNEGLDEINRWYNGYSFDGSEKVFNPFSTLSALKNGEFSHYWFSTGTPHFLVDILKNRRINIDFKNMLINEKDLNEIDPMNVGDLPLLFQGGYLTIDKKFKNELNESEYVLKIPNFEVEQAYEDNLTKLYIEKFENKFKNSKKAIWDEIISGNCKKLSENLRAFIVGIPYHNRISIDNKEKWKVYSLLFKIWAEEADFYLTEEKAIEDGRIDFVLEDNKQNQTLIVEMKYTADQSKSLDSLINESFKQIENKKYWWAYTDDIRLMALAIKDIKIDDGFTTDVKCKIKNIPDEKDLM
jgi:hypothetical protein